MNVIFNSSKRNALLDYALKNSDRFKDWMWLRELSFFYDIIIDNGDIIICDKEKFDKE